MNAVTMDDLRRILVECAGGDEALPKDIVDVEFAALGYDSLALIETAARLRREFGVTISDDRVTELSTPADMLAAVNTRTTHHSVTVDAPAAAVYALLADVTLAPTLFAAPIHYRHSERGAHHERFRIWGLANDQVASWTSVRHLDPAGHVITFEQEHPHPLVSAMRGVFRMTERDGTTEVALDHEFATTDPDFVGRAIDTNSTAQLAALRRLAELPLGELLHTTTDTVEVDGRAEDAYEFVHDVGQWPERLPHIGSVDVREDGDVQYLTKTVGEHTSRSVRLCFPTERIVFKQLTPPAALLGNAGEWTFTPTPAGCTVTVRHTVLLAPDADRDRIRADIAATARRTLLGARRFAERRASA